MATLGQSRPGIDGYERVIHIPQSSSITETSPSDCLVSYPGHSLRGSYLSTAVQSVYSTAPANWENLTLDLYVIMLSVKQSGIKYHFVVRLTEIAPWTPGPLPNTLHIWPMAYYIYIYIYIYIYLTYQIYIYIYIYIYIFTNQLSTSIHGTRKKTKNPWPGTREKNISNHGPYIYIYIYAYTHTHIYIKKI